ncbi:MAG: hypothetical protein JW809_19420 [Pirellulales bacterium]|nr:hypothetical protein [Pirellulales bacterium]
MNTITTWVLGFGTATFAAAGTVLATDVPSGWEGAANFTATTAVIVIAVALSVKVGPLLLGKYHEVVEANNQALRANARSARRLARSIDRLEQRVGPARPSPEAAARAPRGDAPTGGV